jgi:hypothetical protein
VDCWNPPATQAPAARKKPWLFATLILVGLIVLNAIFY